MRKHESISRPDRPHQRRQLTAHARSASENASTCALAPSEPSSLYWDFIARLEYKYHWSKSEVFMYIGGVARVEQGTLATNIGRGRPPESARGRRAPFAINEIVEIVRACVAKAQMLYPSLGITGHRNGYFRHDDEVDVVAAVRAAEPDILLLGFGTPAKECFMHRHYRELGVPFVMGVGGSSLGVIAALEIAGARRSGRPLGAMDVSHDLRWYLSRLGAMSAAEIAHRSYRAARAPVDQLRMRTGRHARPTAAMRAHHEQGQGPEPFYFDRDLARTPTCPELADEAEAIVAALTLGGELRSLHVPAMTQLIRELDRQIFADGVNAEMATHYHVFVLEGLAELAAAHGVHFSPHEHATP